MLRLKQKLGETQQNKKDVWSPNIIEKKKIKKQRDRIIQMGKRKNGEIDEEEDDWPLSDHQILLYSQLTKSSSAHNSLLKSLSCFFYLSLSLLRAKKQTGTGHKNKKQKVKQNLFSLSDCWVVEEYKN